MPAKKFLLLTVFLFLFSNLASAAVFTVTSNADSGAGTLREALTLAAANGTAVKDYIYFNIANVTEAGRTITLLTDLPYVSSDVIIDGTTQPGANLGVSNSKIKITVNRQQFRTAQIVEHACSAALFILNAQNVEVYGLYITNFYALTSIYGYDSTPGAAIYLSNAKNIKIGAPGKGNVLFDNEYGVAGGFFGDGQNSFVEVKSNFIECDIDGKSASTITYTVNSALYIYANDVLIGGDQPGERNYLGACNYIIGAGGTNYSIINNYIAVDFFDNSQVNIDGTTLTGHVDLGGENVIFRNNVFSYMLLGVGCKNFKIYSNVDKSPTPSLVPIIEIGGAENGVIGSDDITEINKITGNSSSSAIHAYASKNIRILKNSIICSNYAYDTDDEAAPKINILINNNTELSGTATPNSVVYIYEDNRDCPVCSPVQFYTTTTTDAGGNWKITGNFINKKWVANTTLQQTSSEFTQPHFPYFTNTNSAVKNPTCGASNGSIAISNYKYILNIKWYNENDEEIGQGDKIEGLKPGIYYAIGFNGNCSTIKSNTFNLYDEHPVFFDNSKKVINPSCGVGGSISGILVATSPQSTASYRWTEKTAGLVGNTLDIDNLPAGEYTLTVKDDVTGCEKPYGPIILTNTTGPNINESNPIKTPSSCTVANGSIHGVTATGTNVKYSWKNEALVEVGTSSDLDNQPAGKYTLTVTDDSNCSPVTSSPIEILAINDITINTATKNIQDANCDNADGAITNITVTGSGAYLWTNEQGVDVGHDKDLTAVPAGRYKLTVTSTSCPPVSTEFIEILEVNGITIDESHFTKTAATCNTPSGSVTGITATGATTYVWTNATGQTVGTDLNLTGMPTGDYKLTVSNAFGCSKTTGVYHIDQPAPEAFPNYTYHIIKSCNSADNGEVIVDHDFLVSHAKWVNSNGNTVSELAHLMNAAPGVYKLYLTDQNGCESYYNTYTITEAPPFTFSNTGVKFNAHCGLSNGSITGITVTGGTPPYTYKWANAAGQVIATTPDIKNLSPGAYSFTAYSTGDNCGALGVFYNIDDEAQSIDMPIVSNLQLCSHGNALLKINNADATATYRLYDSETSPQPIDEQAGGKFTINITGNRSYYVSLIYGACESPRAEVKVMLGSITSGIANTFTPNGDGYNDYWKITGMENYTSGTVKVFSRDGKMVFQSKGYAVPFDGTLNGKPLPSGVYYYIIDLKSCSLLSGNLTILR